MVEKMSGDSGNSRASNALHKRADSIKKWKQSETAKEADVRVENQFTIRFDAGTVFLACVTAGDIDEATRFLDKNIVDIDYTNVDGLTALHQACIDENIDMVTLLVDNGADIEARDNEGWTPLHAAVSAGDIDIVRFLLDHEADLMAANNEGEVPLDLAEDEEMEEFLCEIIEEKDLELDDARGEEEQQMLEDAQTWMNNRKVEEVLDWQGATALHVAAAKNYKKVISLLLQCGVDVNAKDVDNWTPLHAACHWGAQAALELLTDAGADFEARNDAGQTPCDLADSDFIQTAENCKKKSKEKNFTKGSSDEGPIPERAEYGIKLLKTEPKKLALTKRADDWVDYADRKNSQAGTVANGSVKKGEEKKKEITPAVNDRDTKKEEKKEPPKKKKPSDSSEESDIEDGKSKAASEPTKPERVTPPAKPSTSSEAPARPSSSRFSDRSSSDRPGPDRPVSSGPDRPGSTSTSAPDRPGPTRPGSISSIGNKSPLTSNSNTPSRPPSKFDLPKKAEDKPAFNKFGPPRPSSTDSKTEEKLSSIGNKFGSRSASSSSKEDVQDAGKPVFSLPNSRNTGGPSRPSSVSGLTSKAEDSSGPAKPFSSRDRPSSASSNDSGPARPGGVKSAWERRSDEKKSNPVPEESKLQNRWNNKTRKEEEDQEEPDTKRHTGDSENSTTTSTEPAKMSIAERLRKKNQELLSNDSSTSVGTSSNSSIYERPSRPNMDSMSSGGISKRTQNISSASTSSSSSSSDSSEVADLRSQLERALKDVQSYKSKYDEMVKEKDQLQKEKEQIEKKLEKAQQSEKELTADRDRLKDENGALIRVISKLSRTPTSGTPAS